MVGSFFPYILFHVFIFQNSYKKYVLSQFYFISFFKDFIRCGPFLKSSLNLLQYCFCFMFWFFGHEACGMLAPQPGIKLAPPALEGEAVTTVLPGKSIVSIFLRLTRL